MRTRSLMYTMFLTILSLTIGFATIATNFIMDGTISFGINDDDFDVVFTKSIVDDIDVSSSTISADGKTLNFFTKDLSVVGDYTKLEFEVTNNSTQYDANLFIDCVSVGDYSQYYSIKKSIPSIVYSQSKESGTIQVILEKNSVNNIQDSFSCTIEASALERVDIGEISESIVSDYSIYSWEDTAMLSYNIEETISVLNNLSIGSVYHSFDEGTLLNDFTKNVTSTLNKHNMDTYALVGVPEWYNKTDVLKERIDRIIYYNSNVSEEQKITGIVFDIEPYLVDEFESDVVEGFVSYATTMENAYNYANENGVKVVNVIPYWYDVKYLDSSTYSEDDIKTIEDSIKKVFKNSHRISVMNYYKKNMLNAIEYEVSLAEEYGIEIESIGEFSRPDGDAKPNTISLWIENDPIGYVKNIWSDISEKYNYDKISFSYHELDSILEIKGLYSRNKFEILDSDSNTVDIDELYVRFPDGSYETIDISEERALPKNSNYEIILYGNEIINIEKNDLGDNRESSILTVSSLEKYTLEVYPSLYDGTKYNSMASGTVTLINEILGIEKTVDIRPEKYAVLTHIYANTDYKVIVKDIDGNSYTFEYATIKDSDGNPVIISDGETISIPQGFNSNLYVAPKLYLK